MWIKNVFPEVGIIEIANALILAEVGVGCCKESRLVKAGRV